MTRPIALLGLAAALGGCSLAPRYATPSPPIPTSWPVGDAYVAQRDAPLPTVSYAELFRDARLQSLIRQALANNDLTGAQDLAARAEALDGLVVERVHEQRRSADDARELAARFGADALPRQDRADVRVLDVERLDLGVQRAHHQRRAHDFKPRGIELANKPDEKCRDTAETRPLAQQPVGNREDRKSVV